MLTDTKLKHLKPTDKCKSTRPDKYSDRNGLQIWVRPTGTKSWISAYRFNGKQQSLTIGKYPEISLQEARRKNDEIKGFIERDINPKLALRKLKHEKRNAVMFNDYALTWLAERKTIVKERTYQQDYNRLHKDVIPSFQDIPLKDANFDHCKAMADVIESRLNADGNPPREVTRRTIALVEQIFKRAKLERLIQSNPAADLKELYPKAKSQHMKHVDIDELPQLLRDIENYHGHDQTRLAMKFLAYSFCRTIELRMMNGNTH